MRGDHVPWHPWKCTLPRSLETSAAERPHFPIMTAACARFLVQRKSRCGGGLHSLEMELKCTDVVVVTDSAAPLVKAANIRRHFLFFSTKSAPTVSYLCWHNLTGIMQLLNSRACELKERVLKSQIEVGAHQIMMTCIIQSENTQIKHSYVWLNYWWIIIINVAFTMKNNIRL